MDKFTRYSWHNVTIIILHYFDFDFNVSIELLYRTT